MKKTEQKPLSRREKRAEIVAAKSGGADFVRGKTLSKGKQPSERLKNRKLVVRRRKLGMFFSGVAGLAVCILIFLLQFAAKVDVVGEDGKALDQKYLAAVSKYYDEQPFERVVSQLKQDDLLRAIQIEFPEVGDILAVKFKGVGHYQISLSMRRPVASWTVGQKKIYVDESGVSFDKNYFDEPELNVVDEAIYDVESGVSVAGGSFIKFVGRLVSVSKDNGFTISKIKIPQDALRYVEVNFEEIAYPVKFSSVSSVEGQVQNLGIASAFFTENGKSPKYLDLRVEGKGYYQ